MRSIAVLVMMSASFSAAAANDLRVLVTGIETGEGEVSCSLFNGSEGFPAEAARAVTTKRYPAVPGMLTCTFEDVPEGWYAVSASHDRNANRKLDRSLFGSGQEPWGVSNNVRSESRAPRFAEASVRKDPDRSLDVEVSLRR